MKLSVLSFVLLINLSLYSQITIDQNDMPNIDDTIRLSNSIDMGTLNYSETGNNFTWDFSSLEPFTQSVDTFVSVLETPWIYQLMFFGSNLAQPKQGFDQFQGFQVTDAYDFYKNSNSDFQKTGYGVTLNGIPIPSKYEEPDIIFKFPLNYGNIDSSLSSYELDIPGIGFTGGWKKRVNYVDGWGTLVTPYGEFETIRVKSNIVQYDSTFIDSLGIGLPITRNFTEYKWLGDNFGLPLCTFTDDGLLTSISYIDSVRTLFTGTDLLYETQPEIKVYPNPINQELTIELKSNDHSEVYISLKSLTGETLMTLESGKKINGEYCRTFMIDHSKVGKGIYFIYIKCSDMVYAEKIIIN